VQLENIIRQHIQEKGPISFHDFMEMSLYYPGLGYYTSPTDKIGKQGDYYTSPHLTPAFGATLAAQLEEMWDLLGRKEFTIVEYGAGTGFLCHDILNHLKKNKFFYDRLRYCIIEKSAEMMKKEKAHLHEKVSWHTSLHEIKPISGCVLSNELLDNFSVHQVMMQDELMEIFVTADPSKGFIEELKPASEHLKEYLNELHISLPKGFRTEINLEAIEWIKEIATCLKEGYVLTIDYGYSSAELYHERKRNGTLICYHQHQINDCPFEHIGEQDITSHVNFSALCHWGLKSGLRCCGFTNQANFLLGLGFKNHLRNLQTSPQNLISQALQETFLTRTLLLEMGYKFKVLIQGKSVPFQQLSGLKQA
jgi:SAM-dependent MidA family methyltransferase